MADVDDVVTEDLLVRPPPLDRELALGLARGRLYFDASYRPLTTVEAIKAELRRTGRVLGPRLDLRATPKQVRLPQL